ncbi:iron ABC transporter permease [Lonepinella koalarum]|uniref:FecCD family ABC transporter permease n=1 Tax=Lonepinella koalarum TaxID=53417 RepID=UPI0011E401E3|nr:iron ABC transporter permease [Lonepinella koalarum]TYG34082.1 iron ABC transporter permease [Lonepinella koalarum]
MKYRFFLSLLIALMLLGILIALSMGRMHIPLENVMNTLLGNNPNEVENNVILILRLPRILTALLVGAGLAIAGVTYQGVFKNPLVSPDILGVSGGACIGASVAILFGLGSFSIQILAFIGGVVAVSLTMLVPLLMRRDSMIILVLSGIIVGGFMGASLGLIKYLADPETQLADIVYWSMGSLTKSNFKNLIAFSPVMIITALVLLLLRWRINLLSLGEQQAKLIGVNIKMERNVMILCSTLLTASAVCLSGTIGWIGLVIPHLARLLIGDDNIKTLPLAALIGAIFLLLIDTLARNLYTEEIPLGILTGFIGAPFFAWVLVKQRMVK